MQRVILLLGLSLSGLYGQNCVPTPVLPTANVAGSLSSTSCALSDGTPYASYRLTLPVRGQAQISLNPNPAGLNLILQDGSGAQIASGSSIQRSLELGAYTILVNLPALASAGTLQSSLNFTLQAAFTAEPGMLCNGFPLIGLGQAAAGLLGSSGCMLPDGTLYEAYVLNTFGAGNLTVTVSGQGFTPLLLVRGEDGSLLGSDPASVTVAVDDSSQYQIVVATSDTTGAFQVSTSFTPAATETCLPQNSQAAPMTDKNAITTNSCSSIIDDMGDLAFYNYYNIAVPSAGQATISVNSTDFAPTLYLLDANGNTVGIDSGGGAAGSNWPGSELSLTIPAGSYIIEVFSNYTSGGNYQMAYNFTAGTPQQCPTGVLTLGTPAAGTLSPSSCRTQLGLSDIYTLSLPAAGTLTLDLNTSNFTGQVAVRDTKDNLIVLNQDVEGVGNSHVSATLPGGNYTIVAGDISGSGAYQLVTSFAPASIAPCTYAQPLNLNGGYIQILGPSSCVGVNGQPMDQYQFTLPNDGTIAAVMTSNQLDGYLTLTDSSGNVLRSDDNSYGYNDPLIVQFLAAGTYQLTARAASGTVGGMYQVNLLASLGARPPFCNSKGTLAPGASISGALTFTACQYIDATFADVYQMTLAANTTIDLRLNSTDFDAYLVILDAKGNLIAQDDDSGGGTNSRIQQSLVAGNYYVFVKPFANYYSLGNYTLTLAGQ
jgi:hypothetical protein